MAEQDLHSSFYGNFETIGKVQRLRQLKNTNIIIDAQIARKVSEGEKGRAERKCKKIAELKEKVEEKKKRYEGKNSEGKNNKKIEGLNLELTGLAKKEDSASKDLKKAQNNYDKEDALYTELKEEKRRLERFVAKNGLD